MPTRVTQLRTKRKAPHRPRPASAGESSPGDGTRRVRAAPGRRLRRGEVRGRPRADSGKRLRPGHKPGGVSGTRRGVSGRGPGAEEVQGEARRSVRPKGAPSTRAAHSPPAAAPVAARCCEARLPGRPGRSPTAAGLALPPAPRPAQPPTPPRLRPPQLRVPAPGQRRRRGEEAASRGQGGEAVAAPGHPAPRCARPGPRPTCDWSREAPVAPPPLRQQPLPSPLRLPARLLVAAQRAEQSGPEAFGGGA